jgi:hypothetical protein
MYVANDTDRTIMLRVQISVARVDPGASGPAVAWQGDRDVPVEVLDTDCGVIGTLETVDGTSYFVDELPGLSGHIEEWDLVWGNQTPGIVDTNDCGGDLPR